MGLCVFFDKVCNYFNCMNNIGNILLFIWCDIISYMFIWIGIMYGWFKFMYYKDIIWENWYW